MLTAAVALGAVWRVTDLLKAVLGARRRIEPPPQVILGQDGEGRWVIYENGVVTGVAGRPEVFAVVNLLQESRVRHLPLQR